MDECEPLAAGTADGRVAWVDPRMLSSSLSGGSDNGAVMFITTAHSGGGVTGLRWQHAVDAAASSTMAAAEAQTPTPMRAPRPASAMVGRCRLMVSKPVLTAPGVSALEATT